MAGVAYERDTARRYLLRQEGASVSVLAVFAIIAVVWVIIVVGELRD